METKEHPPPQSPPIVTNMHDEGLQPLPQSYEFTPQQHHHHDYGYNLQFFNASKEDYMSNLICIYLLTLESAYAYMQSILILLFSSVHQTIVGSSSTNQPNINDFIQREQLVIPDKQLQPQEYG